jgi:hypothetical protein
LLSETLVLGVIPIFLKKIKTRIGEVFGEQNARQAVGTAGDKAAPVDKLESRPAGQI